MRIDIPGYRGYTVDDVDYKIYGIRGNELKEHINGKGYVYVEMRVSNKNVMVRKNRLIASMFVPNPHNLPQVNHKNGNKLDNHPSNLEWCTCGYNIKHAYNSGLHNSSGRNVEQYDNNGTLINTFVSVSDASRATGLAMSGIIACCKGRYKTCGGYTWKYSL